jgi:hypothetical protein
MSRAALLLVAHQSEAPEAVSFSNAYQQNALDPRHVLTGELSMPAFVKLVFPEYPDNVDSGTQGR